MKTDVEAYLKSAGFRFGTSPARLDRLFHKSLNKEGKALFELYSESAQSGISDIQDVFQIPQSAKQAALLLSQDVNRSVASMEWICSVLKDQSPGTAIDIGCGAGFSLDYFSKRFTRFSFEGLESQTNLASIASELTGFNIWNMNYLHKLPEKTYDYIICEFGWNSSDINDAPPPHQLRVIDEYQICAGCTGAAENSFHKMLESWTSIMSDIGKIIVTGRLRHIGDTIAFLNAANSCGLQSSNELNNFIYWSRSKEFERTPALVLVKGETKTESEIVETAVKLYKRAKHKNRGLPAD